MTIYYVSSEIGNNNNAGTSQSAPLASLQAAANLVKPGDTVQVMNGTYTAPSYADALDITTSGTASAPITFEAAPGQTPVIDSSGGWNAINIQASYIVVSGFTVIGDAANYNLPSALAGYSTGNANLDGNGITVNPSPSVPLPNHITIENNTVSNEPGGGIGLDGADYVQILNNVVHNNANWSAFGNSGITINSSVNLNTNPGPHDIISGNLVYDNAQLVPTNGAGGITDGEGIILDTNPNYTSEMLVENNTVYGNGGPGIESFLTNNATITENTVYGNDTQSRQPQSDAEIFINQSNNDTVTNNDTANPNVAVPTISQGVLNANDSVTLTGTAIAGSTVTVSDGGTSPLGTTVANGSGSWSFTTLILAAGNPSFTATDTISIGTSAASNTLSLTVPTNAANAQTPAAPVISAITENPDESITLTGTAVANSTVTVWSTTGNNDGTATASSSGAWSFTTPVLNLGIYGYYATDTTPGGTSAKSNALGTQVVSDPANAAPAAPVISAGAVNSNDSVTLTGTAPAGATVTVSDGGANPLGTATASSSGAWSFTTADLSAGAYAFTATDTTSAGTSGKSSALNVTVPPTVANNAPAAPTIPYGVVNSNHSVTLTGTAPGGSAVTVSDGGANPLGTTTANSAFVWTFTTADLPAGAYTFTATDTTSAGTSAVSKPLQVTVPSAPNSSPPAAPVISKIVVNSNDSLTLTGTAVANSTVTVWSTTGVNDGTTTANGSGAWSFTTPVLLPSVYGYMATDTTAAGTSAKSNALGATVPAATAPTAPLPAAPTIPYGVVNSNDSVTLTGTAPAGSTVTVSDGGANPLGTATANSAFVWSFTTADLSPGAYAFTATDTTSAGTSAKSSALDVTVPAATRTVVSNALEAAPAEALPAAPSLTDIAVNSNDSVTLKGTAVDGSTVTVWSTTGTNDGTTTASTSGAWSFTTPDLLPGVYGYTATDTTSAGTSVKSNALGVTVPAQSFSANGNQYGEEINLSATSDELDLSASAVTVTRGSGTESLLAGSSDFPFSSSDYRSTETIDAQPGDHFVFNPGFGHETIQGFQAMGSEADTLQLSISSFSYLNVGMSQAADLAALLTHSTGGTSATTITDSSGDTLTLAGLSRTTIAADAAANSSLVKFV